MTLFRGTVRRLGLITLLGALSVAAGCDERVVDPPDPFEPIDNWHATTFNATVLGTVYDLLEEGGSISVTLHADHRTSGTYVFPDLPDLQGEQLALSGTWQRLSPTSNGIIFEHEGDSYMEALVFYGGGDQMVGEAVVDGVPIRIVLERS